MNESSPGDPMSSQVTVGDTAMSASQPAVEIASATTMTGPSSQAGVAIDFSQPSRRSTRRSSLFPKLPGGMRHVSRADCIRLALVGVVLAGVVAIVPAGGQEAVSAIAPINELRVEDELPPVEGSDALDAVAERYLEAMLDAQCLCPLAAGQAGADRLLEDVRTALGSDAAVVDAGLVAGYDQSPDAAILTVVRDPENGAAILGSRMTLFGLATRIVEASEGWLVPPPGGTGPEIELTGYSVVVIVMAGSDQ